MFKNTFSPESIFASIFFTLAGTVLSILCARVENIQRYIDAYGFQRSELYELGLYTFVAFICIIAGIGLLRKIKWIMLITQAILILVALALALGILFSISETSSFQSFVMLSVFGFYGGVFGFFVFGLTNKGLFPWSNQTPNLVEDQLLDFEHRNDLADD